MSYFGQIRRGIKTSIKGLSLTWRHLWAARRGLGPRNVQDPGYFQFGAGHVTLQYPHEMISIPDHGRNQLDCEIDDCIVCDKCAKICPVNCIEIEAIKSPDIIRHTSDGSPVRLHAAKFNIDLAKCCFCGLCTTVCPTECLTMNNEFDYSVLDIRDLNFAFSNLSEAEVQEKQALYDQYMAEKAEAKAKISTESTEAKKASEVARPRPAFMPKAKPEGTTTALSGENDEIEAPKPRPSFVPKSKPKVAESDSSQEPTPSGEPVAKSKPVFVPKSRPSETVGDDTTAPAVENTPKPKPVFRPKIKPEVSQEEVAKSDRPQDEVQSAESKSTDTEAHQVVEKPFIPKMKPKAE